MVLADFPFFRSAVKDMGKQRAVEHTELIEEFKKLTSHPDGLLGVLEATLHEHSDDANFEAKKILGALFQVQIEYIVVINICCTFIQNLYCMQESYDSCKKMVINAITTQLESLFEVQQTKTEEMDDASRGYGLLLSACGLRTEKMRAQYSTKIKENVSLK